MNDLVPLLIALPGGMLLGVLFYGGLWFTVRHGLSSAYAGLWFTASFLLRMAAVLSGFYFIAAGRWEKLFFCLAGFMLARVLVTRLTKKTSKGGAA